MTDGSIEGSVIGVCDQCQGPIRPEDDAIQLAGIKGHLECEIRSIIGDVPHLEGQCSCYGGTEHDERPYREGAKAALQWLIDNGRGKWA